MKQRITVTQLNKMTDAQRKTLREWWNPQQGDVCLDLNNSVIVLNYVDDEITANLRKNERNPLLSIGQMIEFIQEKKPQLKGISKNRFEKWFVNLESGQLGYKDELCDALWETTVQILKNTVQG